MNRITYLSAVAFTVVAMSAASATELRGRVESKNPYTGSIFPRQGASVDVTMWSGNQWVIVRKTMTGGDGMYYLSRLAPGSYVLVVNGHRFPLGVGNGPSQDIGPILVP